jgi:hypothetical protein
MLSEHGRAVATSACSRFLTKSATVSSRRFLGTHAVRAQVVPETISPAIPNGGLQPLHLILLGAPGAGKGTQTDSLLRKFDLRSLVVGNLLRDEVARKSEVGIKAAKVMKEGGLLEDATILEVVKPGLKQMNGKDWILVRCRLSCCNCSYYSRLRISTSKTFDHAVY